MKQMKFLLVALMAVVMSVSVTSCMKGDDNTTGSGYTVAKVKSNMSSISFTTIDGYTLLAGANSSLTTAKPGDFVYLAYTYDTETDVDAASKTIKITIAGAQIVSGNPIWEFRRVKMVNHISPISLLSLFQMVFYHH